MTGGHIHVINNTQTKIMVILPIKNKIKPNKMSNIDNTENNWY